MDREDYVAEEYYSDENHFGNFVTFDNVKNGWVRNVTALHFVTSMVGTLAGSKWITVQDCVSREPISQRRGGRRFIFALRGQLALVQRCQSDKGRHSFMMGQPTGSGNVFLDCKATSPYSSSEPHEHWANGGVYDNVQAPLTARFWKNISIGWAGANTVFWNCEGHFLVQKPPTAQNYTFGHIGVNSVVFNIPLQDTDQGERAHRVARPARHAAQPVPDAAARAARRRGRPQRRRAEPARLTSRAGAATASMDCSNSPLEVRPLPGITGGGGWRPGGHVTRREFLAAAAAAAALGRTTASANPLGLPFGFQAWEIGPDMRKDWDGTLKAMKDYGYSYVDLNQVAPFTERSAADLKASFISHGFTFTNALWPYQAFANRFDQTIADSPHARPDARSSARRVRACARPTTGRALRTS